MDVMGFLGGFDLNILFYGVAFLIVFFGSRFILNKSVFKKTPVVGAVLGAIIALFVLYGLYQMNLDFRFGIDENIIHIIYTIALLIFTVFLMWKWGLHAVFMIYGLILILLGAFEIVYQAEVSIIFGIILFLLGLLMWWRKRRKEKDDPDNSDNPDERKDKRDRKPKKIPEGKYNLSVSIKGKGNSSPSPGNHVYKEGKKVSIKAKSGKFKHMILDRRTISKSKVKIRMNQNHQIILVFEEKGKRDDPENKKRAPRNPGEASLDVIVGRSFVKNGSTTLDLRNANEFIIYVKNGGTGGSLGWRASSHKELSISKAHGKLPKGKTQAIKVIVKNRTGRKNPAVIINGRGGGRRSGRATRGRVIIYFKVS
ncbi:MAG: hypothetical protein U9Q99_03235 [Nanoarchaeota archaeon]|nr:hypothetical protein [Nanoarchaeota archaeon]